MEHPLLRLLKIFKPYAKYILIGLLYLVWVRFTGISIPCPIHAVTGYYCPGCGITTLFLCLFEGDFHGAFLANPALFILLPVIFCLVVKDNINKENNERNDKTYNIITGVVIITLLMYGIIRNL